MEAESHSAPLLLTARDAAQTLAISQRTLWTLTNRGEIPCMRLGRSVRYDRKDLVRWIAAHKEGDATQ